MSLFGAVADHYVAAGGGTNNYAATVLADSPLAYYRQGDASGSTMTDSSGHGRDGSYVNSPTLGAAGLLTSGTDTAVTYNGTTQYGEESFSSWMNGMTSLTLEAIIKTTATSGTVLGRGGSNRNYRIGVTTGKAFIEINAGGFPFLTGSTAVNDGDPHHVAATWDGTTLRLYIDGVADGTLSASGSLSTAANPLRVAQRSGDSFFAGTVQECALYGTALSSTRIAAHAAAR